MFNKGNGNLALGSIEANVILRKNTPKRKSYAEAEGGSHGTVPLYVVLNIAEFLQTKGL